MLSSAKNFAVRLWKDERGAAMLEYSILVGLITAGVVGIILFVGGYINNAWDTLRTNLKEAKSS